jgi:hypothetical protein
MLLFAGSFLLQLAWIVSLPPFRGIDEFDHAYRAAAVAHGQWIAGPDVPERDGRGSFVTVERRLVAAARPECEDYGYTGYANCNPVRDLGGGYVTVASAAARYNPVFYWIVGTPANWFHGARSLFVMRMVASLMCSAMVAFVGWILTQWAQTRWPLVGMLVGLTPTVVYSTVLPAPNGVEMLGGLGLWAALLGLGQVEGQAERERRLLWCAVAMAIPLTFVRSLGPLWLAMIVTSMFGYLGWRRIRTLVDANRRAWGAGTAMVVVAALAGGAWSLASSTNAPSTEPYAHYAHALSGSIPQLYLWVFQSFAAFPARNEFPPLWVFATGMLVFGLLLTVAVKLATVRLRILMVWITAGSLGVPFLITLATFSRLGTAWQGRYTLPFSLGLALVAGLVLELNHERLQFARPSLVCGIGLYTAAHLGGTLHVLVTERAHSPLSGTSEWPVPPTWLVSLAIVGGMAICTGALLGSAGPRLAPVHPSRTLTATV